MAAFSYSGFKTKVYGNITSYCKSFVGRDFKVWAQMALFIMTPYLSEEEATIWLNLIKVHAHYSYNMRMCKLDLYIMYIAYIPGILISTTLLGKEQSGKQYVRALRPYTSHCL